MSSALSAPPAAPTISADAAATGSGRPKSCCAAPNTTADEAEHRADRQVDAAGDDDRRQRDGQQPELHAEPGDLEEVADGEESSARRRRRARSRASASEDAAIRRSATSAPRQAMRGQARLRRRAARAWVAGRCRHASIATAARMIAPCSARSQYAFTPRNVRAGPIAPSRMTPSSVPANVPRPPRIAVPPTTTAAIDLHLQPEAGVAWNLVEADGVEDRGQAGQRAGGGEDRPLDARRVEAGQPRGVGIRSGGVNRAAGRKIGAAPRHQHQQASGHEQREQSDRRACDRPSHWNPAGRSCTHAPCVVHRSPSRSATIVASVTTIDGSRRYATSAPLRRAQRGAAGARDDEHAEHRHACLRRNAREHAADREHRSDGDVDLAGEDHERRAKRDDQNRQVGEEQVAEVLPREVAGRGDGEQGGERHDRGSNRHFTTMSRQHGGGLGAGARRSALGARRSALGVSALGRA